MSTFFCCRNGSRLADTVSTKSILSAGMPSSPASRVAIRTSKPSGLPCRFFSPNSGWSNFVPTVIFCALLRASIVEPAGKLTAGAGVAAVVVVPLLAAAGDGERQAEQGQGQAGAGRDVVRAWGSSGLGRASASRILDRKSRARSLCGAGEEVGGRRPPRRCGRRP